MHGEGTRQEKSRRLTVLGGRQGLVSNPETGGQNGPIVVPERLAARCRDGRHPLWAECLPRGPSPSRGRRSPPCTSAGPSTGLRPNILVLLPSLLVRSAELAVVGLRVPWGGHPAWGFRRVAARLCYLCAFEIFPNVTKLPLGP